MWTSSPEFLVFHMAKCILDSRVLVFPLRPLVWQAFLWNGPCSQRNVSDNRRRPLLFYVHFQEFGQRAPTQEQALVKVKRVAPWCRGRSLSCLAVPGLSWPRVLASPALSWRVPVLFFFACIWLWASRSSSQMGGTSGQISFPFPVDGQRAE